MEKAIRSHFWFYLFLLFHLLAWTIVPFVVRDNLPLDSIEGSIWGHHLQWGYDKNPYLNGWLTALAVYLGGYSGWMIYLFSQLSVVICFWAIFNLASVMLTPCYALIAVMILEGAQYYNFHAIDFNDNNLELSTWALTIYFFYRALARKNNYTTWIITGLCAGFALMAKYYTLVLLFSMLLLMIIHHRQQFRHPAPYLGLLAFFLVIFPHLYWLPSHDYITITYVFARASSPPSWLNHFFYPAQFAWQQAQVFLPVMGLAGLLFIGQRPFFNPHRILLHARDRSFLLYIGLGPLLLTLFLSFILGIKLRAGWGMPLLSLWGVILIAWWQPNLTPQKLYRFIASIFLLTLGSLVIYADSLLHSPDPSSANFPGKEIARVITDAWHTKYHTPLFYVAGSRWIGGNIQFYSKDHPAHFVEWDKQRAPWINDKDLQEKGAVFVWEITGREILPEEVKKQFPQLSQPQLFKFSWLRNDYHLDPIQIGVAWLPPSTHGLTDEHIR